MRTLSIAGLALLAPLASAGNVHIVGGPASTAATIQLAVDAAVDGDVVLVRTTPQGAFAVGDKSLTIVGEIANATIDGTVSLQGLSAAKSVAIRGFAITPPAGTLALQIFGCAGHVRLDDLSVVRGPGFTVSASLVSIANSADVTLTHATVADNSVLVTGGSGPALGVSNSSLSIDACTIAGTRGSDGQIQGFNVIPPIGGLPAIGVSSNSHLFVQGSVISGGKGGDGTDANCPPMAQGPTVGAPGGSAIFVTSSPDVSFVDALVTGGVGGTGGAGAPGCGFTAAADGTDGAPIVNATPLVFADVARQLSAQALTRELTTLDLVVSGEPGESATLLISSTCQRNVVPGIQGPVLVGPSLRRIPLGIVPGSGVLNASLPLGDLAPGVQGSRRFLQAFCRDANGQVRLTGCTSVVFLDAAY